MGAIARQSRSERFETEFRDDVLRVENLSPGMLLQVRSAELILHGDHVRVCLVANRVSIENGQWRPTTGQPDVYMLGDTVWFDAEMGPDADDIEQLAEMLGISESECRARLVKAELLR